jgi:hypothetical protein
MAVARIRGEALLADSGGVMKTRFSAQPGSRPRMGERLTSQGRGKKGKKIFTLPVLETRF